MKMLSFDLLSVKKHFEEVYEVIKIPSSKSIIDFSKIRVLLIFQKNQWNIWLIMSIRITIHH
jgi:hypothetical protein